MKIRYVLTPMLFLSTAALAQSPQQPASPSDQAFAAVVTGITSAENSIASAKFAMTQYQNAIMAVVRTQAEQIAGLQKQASDREADWKTYWMGYTGQGGAPSTPKP